MRKENRIDFPIPGSTLVKNGFRDPFFGFTASPGDMIVENINNAPSARFLGMEHIPDLPQFHPFRGLMAKWYRTKGAQTDREYLVTVTDEGIMTETGGDIIGGASIGYMMTGENVQRTVVYYRDFHVRQGNISEFLRRFLV